MVKQEVENETPSEKFVRLAEARTQTIIDRLRILSNCSDRRRYSYTDDQVRKIFQAIEQELKIARMKFQEGKGERFRL